LGSHANYLRMSELFSQPRNMNRKRQIKAKELFACFILWVVFVLISAGNAAAETAVSGFIDENVTWTLAESPYIATGSIIVNPEITLTIEPGVTVKFAEDTSIQVDGELIAQGTEAQLITFTSNQSSPAPGDWGYILFNDSSTDAAYDVYGNYTGGSILEYCTIEYAGGADVGNNGAVRMENAHAFINYSTIQHNSASGIFGWDLSEALKITNNTIRNNTTSSYYGGGIHTSTAQGTAGAVTISNNRINNNTASNSGGGIHISGVASISNNIISENTVTSTYVGNGGRGIYVGSAVMVVTTVAISNNVIINNTVSSNGGGIHVNYFNATLTISNNIIAKNRASWYGGGIYRYYCNATISSNSIIGNSAQYGAAIYDSAPFTGDILHNTITKNHVFGPAPAYSVFAETGQHIINYNSIFGNSADTPPLYELYNNNDQGSDDVNAESNYWGSASEPDIQSKIYDFIDDSTKGVVDYTPFLTEPDTAAPISPPANFAAIIVGDTVNLSWSANPESDTTGYKIYYDSDPGFPYANVVDAGNVTGYAFPVGSYIAITAYDDGVAPGAAGDDPDTIVNENQTNGNESWFSTEISNDLDNDGMPDTWETENSLNPNVDDAGDDPDGDRFVNVREFQDQTDPQNSASHHFFPEATGRIPDTGNTRCYDYDNEIPCPQPGETYYGQDGNYTINPPAYTKMDANGNYLPDDAPSWIMVRDNVTGLIWEVKQNKDGTLDYSNLHDADNFYTWYDSNTETNGGHAGSDGGGTNTENFIQALNNAGFGGYSDWRMPTIKELAYIVNNEAHDPSVNTKYFPNTNTYLGGPHWSSTTDAHQAYGAWRVYFASGNVNTLEKPGYHHVRAVRGGPSGALDNLVVNDDGTVTNAYTGLMWEQKTDDGEPNDKDNTYTWEQALAWVESLNSSTYLDYNDWRLPNRNELHSLVDYNVYNPPIDTAAFPNTVPYDHWSSTPYENQAQVAWRVLFIYGHVYNGSNFDSLYHVRAVRGGQSRLSDHLIIIAPAQGSAWSPGGVKEITWDTKEIPGSVKISLSRQGGKEGTFIETIAESTENNGSYTWTVTGPNSVNCMLKIEPLQSEYEDKGAIQGLFTIDNPGMSVNPPSNNFGSAVVGSSCPAESFVISNTGVGDLEISSVSITGTDSADFAAAADNCSDQTIATSGSCTINVRFCPVSSGAKSANLTVISNDPTEPTLNVPLFGEGIAPGTLSVSSSENFQSSGYPRGPFSPYSKIYTLENTGQVEFDWTAAKTMFWIDLSSENGTLGPGDSTTVEVAINEFAEDLLLGIYTDAILFLNTTNGNGNTARSVVLDIEKEPSSIACELSGTSVVLGESLLVTGQITPVPSDIGAGVNIALTSVDQQQTINRTVFADIEGIFYLDVACGDIFSGGQWTVQTSWAGDDDHHGSVSTEQMFQVAAAESHVTLDVTSQAIKLGDTVSISGKFTPQPDCGSGLAGIPITLFISGPGTPDVQYVSTNDQYGHFLLENYSGINALGAWTVQASFSGNDAFLSSLSDPVSVRVIETAGYGVIVQGKISSGEGIGPHNKTTEFVYNSLKDRGLLDDDIMYLNYAYDPGDPGIIDGLPTEAAVQDAISVWARDKMNTKPANLYIVMVNHGGNEVFYINPDTISSTELDGWLDALQDPVTGLQGQAANQEIITILGFCKSGSFIDNLSGAHRVIITSAGPDESSYKGPDDGDVDEWGNILRDGEYFVTEFFKEASYGKSIKNCFKAATTRIEAFTAFGTGSANAANAPYYDTAMQHPVLDDDGDGVGCNEVSETSSDGQFSDTLFIGVSTITGNDPGDVAITQVTETLFLSEGENVANFWARVDDSNRLMTIWVEVKPPGYVPVDTGGTGQAEMDLNRTIGILNGSLDRYEWNGLGDFSTPGTYQVFYFARDNFTGNVSPLMESRAYRAASGNSAPGPLSITSPANGVTVLTRTILDWTDTSDPDEDAMSYTIVLSKDNASFADPIRIENIENSAYLVGPADGIEDLSTYYWKVLAIDQYGALEESPVQVFHTNNTNPVVAWFLGHIYDAATNQTIEGANLLIDGGAVSTDAGGYYLLELDPDVYAFTVSANGYALESFDAITFADSTVTSMDVGLNTLELGNIDGDGHVDLADAIVALKVLAGMDISGLLRSDYAASGTDVNGDNQIGLEEVVYILERVSGLR